MAYDRRCKINRMQYAGLEYCMYKCHGQDKDQCELYQELPGKNICYVYASLQKDKATIMHNRKTGDNKLVTYGILEKILEDHNELDPVKDGEN